MRPHDVANDVVDGLVVPVVSAAAGRFPGRALGNPWETAATNHLLHAEGATHPMLEPLPFPLPLSEGRLENIRLTRGSDPDIAALLQEIDRLQALCDDAEDAFPAGW